MKRIIFSRHANQRLTEVRQEGVTHEDVYAACYKAKEVLYAGVPEELKLKGFLAESGRKFDMVIVDKPLENALLIVTVIGKLDSRKGSAWLDGAKLHDLPYKKRIKYIRNQRKKERKFFEEIKSERYVRSSKADG